MPAVCQSAFRTERRKMAVRNDIVHIRIAAETSGKFCRVPHVFGGYGTLITTSFKMQQIYFDFKVRLYTVINTISKSNSFLHWPRSHTPGVYLIEQKQKRLGSLHGILLDTGT